MTASNRVKGHLTVPHAGIRLACIADGEKTATDRRAVHERHSDTRRDTSTLQRYPEAHRRRGTSEAVVAVDGEALPARTGDDAEQRSDVGQPRHMTSREITLGLVVRMDGDKAPPGAARPPLGRGPRQGPAEGPGASAASSSRSLLLDLFPSPPAHTILGPGLSPEEDHRASRH
jgi:hypothetical protein